MVNLFQRHFLFYRFLCYGRALMAIYLSVAILVGISIVVQSGLNQQIAQRADLISALFYTCIMSFVAAAAVYGLAVVKPQWVPLVLRPQTRFPTWHFYMLFPGLMGFIIICGIPVAINKLGALRVITVVIAVQLLVAALWDATVLGSPVPLKRLAGALITLAGALFTVLS